MPDRLESGRWPVANKGSFFREYSPSRALVNGISCTTKAKHRKSFSNPDHVIPPSVPWFDLEFVRAD